MAPKIKNRSGWPVFIVLSLAPIGFWLTMQPLASRYFNWQTALTSLGQLLGLTGMAMFSLNLVLSARLKWLEPYFSGLNNIYIRHHWVGGLALSFLLFHPLTLAVKFIPVSIVDTARFFLPSVYWEVNFGIFALLTMMILLIITFYVKLPYQIWKLSHQFLGLAFFLASLHVFLIPSDVSRSLPLRVYIFTLVMFGIAGIIYRTLLSWMLVRRFSYAVAAVRELDPAVLEIELAASGGEMKYEPGQFVFVSFRERNFSREPHPFTVSSSPAEHNLRLTIKHLGDFTGDLSRLKPGALAQIEGPFGEFSFLEAGLKNQIWIAGGIGITPFLSMARSLKDRQGYSIDLFYCTKNASEAVFMDELKAIAQENPQLRVIPFYSAEQGHISAELIARTCEIHDRDIFVCGPAPLMKSLKEQFKKLNIPDNLVHTEEFNIL